MGQSEINRQWQRAPLKLKSYLGGSGTFFLSLGKSAPSIFDTISPSALRRRRMSYELEVGKIGSTMWDKNYYYYLPEKLFWFNTARVGIESVTKLVHFWKVLATHFITKGAAESFGHFWCCVEKHHFLFKSYCGHTLFQYLVTLIESNNNSEEGKLIN